MVSRINVYRNIYNDAYKLLSVVYDEDKASRKANLLAVKHTEELFIKINKIKINYINLIIKDLAEDENVE